MLLLISKTPPPCYINTKPHSFTTNIFKVYPISVKKLKPRVVVAVGIKNGLVKRYKKTSWEDPEPIDEFDDGYSEEDEEYQWDSNEVDGEEGDGGEEGGGSGGGDSVSGEVEMVADQYEDKLIKEVEQLLGPEELLILEQNEAPDLSKLSTMKWRPFQTLGMAGMIPHMDKLLDQGVDIDEIDKACVTQDGLTALHKAVIAKKEPVISHLLRKGANPHSIDKNGATPLHYAVQVGALQTVKLLIKYKVDPNVADNEGWTPLHISMQSRLRYIAKVLLVNGADKTRRTKDGKTPLDISLCYGKDFKSYELAKLLKVMPARNY